MAVRSLRLRSLNLPLLLPLLLFLAGLGLRALLLASRPFDGLYGQDAYAYYDFAGALRLAATTGSALPAFFWSLGYPALLAGAFTIFGGAPEIGLAVNVVLAALLPPLVYIIARQLAFRRSAAFAAALILLCCGQALQSSIVLMADIPALFWATLSASALLAYHQQRLVGWLILAAVTLAFACLTRWLYLILLLPYSACFLLMRGCIRHALTAGLCALLPFLPQFAYSLHNPFPLFNHPWVQGWSPTNALQRQFVNLDGTFSYEQVNALFFARPVYDPGYLAPIFAPLAVVGLWALRKRPAPLALLAGWALLPYAFLSGIPFQNIRFGLIVVPAIALLCAAGLDRFPRRTGALRPILYGAVVGIGAAWMLGAGLTNTASFVARQTRDQTVAAWAAGQIPEGAAVYTFDITLTLRHRTPLMVYDLFFETPETLSAKWEVGREDYLLVNLWQLNGQWQQREPYDAVAWLQAHRGLDRLGQQGNYTLFRIRGL